MGVSDAKARSNGKGQEVWEMIIEQIPGAGEAFEIVTGTAASLEGMPHHRATRPPAHINLNRAATRKTDFSGIG